MSRLTGNRGKSGVHFLAGVLTAKKQLAARPDMSTQATQAYRERWYREDDKCPRCQDGRVKICKRNDDGRLFLGCSNFRKSDCRFNADIPERPGYVYVLSNPGYHLDGAPVVKIGYTTQTMKASLDQIYKTGVPFEFRVEFQAMVWKAWATMRQAHITLHAKRLNPDSIDRDFFACSVQEAVEALEAAVRGDISYKAERPPELRSADDNVDLDAHAEPDDTGAGRDKREARPASRHAETSGYVYVLANEVYHDGKAPLLKIGYTTWQPQNRADALYRWDYKNLDYRGVPQRFKLVYSAPFDRAVDAEHSVHEALAAFRVNPYREFFSCTVDQAVTAIQFERAREDREKAEREAIEQARKVREAEQRQAQQQAALRSMTPAHGPVQPYGQPVRGRPRWRSRRRLRRVAIIACVLGAVYAIGHWASWRKMHPMPAPMPSVPKVELHHHAKSKHGGSMKRKRRHFVRKHAPASSPVEAVPQDGMEPMDGENGLDQGASLTGDGS